MSQKYFDLICLPTLTLDTVAIEIQHMGGIAVIATRNLFSACWFFPFISVLCDFITTIFITDKEKQSQNSFLDLV